ncbi:MAG: galactokinase [Chitinophagaceae bacterium]|jgi:galactokinase|nr:galactokinase [Chitinophagaceae bacterium]
MNKKILEAIAKKYEETFHQKPLLVRSPGRVNLIGEHTDYNNGFVMPAAIDKAVYLATGLRNDDEIHLIAYDLDDDFSTKISNIQPSEKEWPNFVLGVVQQLQKQGSAGGFNCVLGGDIPIGAGLSSSAALENGVALSLNELFSLKLDKQAIVKLAQKAENEFVGVKCGIMDMFASMFGKKDHVIQLDCQSLEYKYAPLKMEGIKIVLLDTNVKHSLAFTEYNTRREQCEAGVAIIKKHFPQVNSLRDVSMEMLQQCVADTLIYTRCKYVVEENERLLQGAKDLEQGNIVAFGKKMYQTHDGLSNDYEVSCKELDFLVNEVRNNSDVLGARMMGGGFGGCTINIVKENAVEDLVKNLSAEYKKKMALDLKVYIAQIENGTSIVELTN